LIFTKALEEREKEALEEQNNQQPVHEQKKTAKSKRLRTTVACQTATAWKDKARKKGSSRLETGRTQGETNSSAGKQPLRIQTLNNRTFPMKTLTAAHAVTNRCWAVVRFLIKNRRFRFFAKRFSNHSGFGFENENWFPSLIRLTNLDQNLLVVNL
jgi:hypothetical protein